MEEKKEQLEQALEYADSTNALENNGLEDDELQKIITDIQTGKSDESFLYSVVKLVRKRQEGQNNSAPRR